MFQPGQILKVKVETKPGEFGFGRATIVDRSGKNILVLVKTSKGGNQQLSKGTNLWFVNDSPRLTFNGMWASQVVGSQIVKGKTVLVCTSPKLEPLAQKRALKRVSVNLPVTISFDNEGEEKHDFRTIDLCKSGSSIEASNLEPEVIDVGKELGATLHTEDGEVSIKARVIRIEQNWLQKKTSVALEFIALSKESSDRLDKLLVKLGGNPRSSDLEKLVTESGGGEGLSSWKQQVISGQPDLAKQSEEN